MLIIPKITIDCLACIVYYFFPGFPRCSIFQFMRYPMRRSELIQATKNILDAAQKSGLVALGHDPLRSSDDLYRYIPALHAYAILAARFGPVERALLAIWDLEKLDSSETLENLFKKDREPHEVRSASYRIMQIESYLLPSLEMLDRSIPEVEGWKTLTVLLPADNALQSKPDRLVVAIDAIRKLYVVCAHLEHQDPTTLTVVSCDSGSDIEIIFSGLTMVILAVNKLLNDVYHTWAFQKQTALAINTANVFDKLQVCKEIAELEAQHTISREEAGNLRYELGVAATAIVDAGVVTPEMERLSHGDARQLMAPQQKLIAGPPTPQPPPDQPQPPPTPEIASLSDEERQLLEGLLRRVKQHPDVLRQPSLPNSDRVIDMSERQPEEESDPDDQRRSAI